MKQNSLETISENFLTKWQEIANLLAGIFNVGAVLVMKIENQHFQVFTTNQAANNPFIIGSRKHELDSLLHTIVTTQKKIRIPNALHNNEWHPQTNLPYGMVACWAIPLNFPNKTPFGTLCLLDSHENHFSSDIEKTLYRFQKIMELDLAIIQALDLNETEHSGVINKWFNPNKPYKAPSGVVHQTENPIPEVKTAFETTEHYFKMLIENAPDAIFIQTEWKIAYINKRGLKLFGASAPEQLVGTKILDRVHHNNQTDVKQRITNLNTNKQTQTLYEQILYKLDGTTVHVETSGIPYKYRGKDGALVFVRDITERKQAEKRLREKTDEYYSLYEEYKAQNEQIIEAQQKNLENQKALNHSYELLQYIIEHDRSAVAVHDKNYKYIYVSQSYLKDYNIEDPNIIGKHHYEVFPDLPQKWKDVHKKALQGQVSSAEEDLFVRANGTLQWTRWECRPWYEKDNSIGGFIIYSEVVTDKKLREDKIKSLSDIIENSLNEIYIFDKNTLKFQFANKGALQNSGYSLDELQTLTPVELKPDFDTSEYKQIIAPLLANKQEIIQLETQHRRKDGTIYDISLNLQLAKYNNNEAFVAFVSDISERKKAEREFQRQKKLFESMFDTIQEGVAITNTKRQILLANKGIFTLFGYKPDEIIGQETSLLYANAENFEKAGQHVFNEDAPVPNKNFNTYYKTKTGYVFPGETFGTKLFDENGKWIGNIGIIRDITERKSFIDQLKTAKERAEESDRLKSAFLQNMSHEVRTPLNAIVGFAQVIATADNPADKQQKFADIITQSSNKLLEIITDVIEISRVHAQQITSKITNFDFSLLLAELQNKFSKTADEKKLLFSINSNFEQLKINSDYEKIKKVIFHLVDNAIKFTFEGSITIQCKFHQNKLDILIADTGIGISPQMQALIFEPFRQIETGIRRNFGGNGLGLAIAKAYIELLNGTINLQSELNKGTTFQVTIPTNIDLEKAQNNNAKPVRKTKYTVLIVEDEESNYLYLNELLSKYPFETLHAQTGKQAINLCRNNQNIDLIFMDIKMPDMDGYMAAKILKEFRAQLPIIAQTAYALSQEMERYGGVFDDYLTKPIDDELLFKKVYKYLMLY